MAARMSEMPAARVLLEAGPKDTNPFIHLPVGLFEMTSGNLIRGRCHCGKSRGHDPRRQVKNAKDRYRP